MSKADAKLRFIPNAGAVRPAMTDSATHLAQRWFRSRDGGSLVDCKETSKTAHTRFLFLATSSHAHAAFVRGSVPVRQLGPSFLSGKTIAR